MTPSSTNLPTPAVDLTSRFKSLYTGLHPLLQTLGKDETIKQIDQLFARIASNNVTVLVCGEFKRGKSSLVNALIGEDLCPVDDCIATATVSMIRYGAKTKVTRHYVNGSNQIVTENVDFSQIERFSKGSSANIDNTMSLEIELPSERLKSGLCVIDTPGIGGLDARHLSLTSFALTKTDCVLFVADAGEPVSASELDFIKTKIAPFGRNLKVVLNKVDTLSEDQIPVLVNDTRRKIASHCASVNVEVIPVSIYQWQLYGVTGDESYRAASNMSGLERGLDDIRKTFKQSLYPVLKSCLLQAAGEAKTALQAQLQAITDPNPEMMARLQEQGRAIAQAKKELEQPSSKFNRELAAINDEYQNEVMAKLSSESILLSSSKLDELLNSDIAGTEDGLKYVSEQLNEELETLSAELDEIIDSCFAEIMEKAQASFDSADAAFNAQLPSGMRLREKSLSETVFHVARNGLSGLGMFSFASVVGGILGSTIILPVAGAIGGIIMACKAISGSNQSNRKAEIRQKIQPQLSIAVNELKTYVQNRFKHFNNSLKECLLGRVGEMEAEMMNIRLRLEECSSDMQKIAQQKSELQRKIAFVDSTTNQLNVLLNNPFRTA